MSRARVAMHFADGSVIDSFQKINWKTAFTDPLDHLTITTIPPRDQFRSYRDKLDRGELVTILVNDVLQGAFIVQTAERTTSEAGAAIEATLHTPLITPHEGDVDPDVAVQDKSLTDLVAEVLAPYGFTQVVGDTRASVSAATGKPIGGANKINVPALKPKAAVAHPGTTAYAFLAHVFTRLGVCLRFTPSGVLLVSAPDYDQPSSYTVVRTTRPGSVQGDYFVGQVKIHSSNAGQFSACTVRGQRQMPPLGIQSTNTARPEGAVQASDVLPARSRYKSFVAPWKPRYHEDKKSMDPDTSLNVAHLELGAKAAQAFYIHGPVNGWTAQTGGIWQPDTVVRVVHDLEDIDEEMWIEEVERTQDDKGGQMTSLKIIPKGALILGDPKALAKA